MYLPAGTPAGVVAWAAAGAAPALAAAAGDEARGGERVVRVETEGLVEDRGVKVVAAAERVDVSN